MNIGNKHTFITKNRREVLDVTIASTYLNNYVTTWLVCDEESCSDHRHINFKMKGNITRETYRNIRKTEWEVYNVSRVYNFPRMRMTIRTMADLEMAAKDFNDSVANAFTDTCPY